MIRNDGAGAFRCALIAALALGGGLPVSAQRFPGLPNRAIRNADDVTLAQRIVANDNALALSAIYEAVRRKARSCIPALSRRLADPQDLWLSVAAARALGRKEFRAEGVAGLRQALKDPRPEVRGIAAIALARQRDRAAIPALCAFISGPRLMDPNGMLWMQSDERIIAAYRLSEFGDPTVAHYVHELIPRLNTVERQSLCDVLARLGSEESRALLRRMMREEPYAGTRAAAAKALGRWHSRKDLPALIEALRDRSPLVRREAVHVLVAIGDRSAVPALQRAMNDPSPYALNAPQTDRAARMAAARAVALLGGKR